MYDITFIATAKKERENRTRSIFRYALYEHESATRADILGALNSRKLIYLIIATIFLYGFDDAITSYVITNRRRGGGRVNIKCRVDKHPKTVPTDLRGGGGGRELRRRLDREF